MVATTILATTYRAVLLDAWAYAVDLVRPRGVESCRAGLRNPESVAPLRARDSPGRTFAISLIRLSNWSSMPTAHEHYRDNKRDAFALLGLTGRRAVS
jgi:hypothetical protein